MSARWPPAVGPGDRVGIAALSGAIDPERLEAGVEGLRSLGLEPVPADNLRSRHGPFAGTDAERLDAFHRLVAEPSLAAIFFARGGSGVLRLLPHVDWELLARHPRAYVGYSDLTPFLLAVVERLGTVAFHGPMVASDLARGLTAEERSSLLGALARRPVPVPVGGWLRRGAAEGRLLGGCLSLLTSLLGTPYFPDLEGALLFIEDVDEPAYRIDRMLTHLALSGTLAGSSGLLVGHLAVRGDEGNGWFREGFLAVPGPVARGLPCGHESPNLTLTLGATARVDPDRGAVVFSSD